LREIPGLSHQTRPKINSCQYDAARVESYNFAGFGSIAMGASGRRHFRLFQERLPVGRWAKHGFNQKD